MKSCASLAALGLLLLLALHAGTAEAGPLGEFVQGTAVPYGGPTDGKDPHVASGGLLEGSCGYGALDQKAWPYWSAAAIAPTSFLAANSSRHPLLGCGACLQLVCDPRSGFEGKCPPNSASTELIAVVTDTCKDCPPNKITLHYLAFQQKLASPDLGEVPIKFRLVECAPPGNITASIDTYRATEGGYLRLWLENVAGTGAIQSLELRSSPVAGDRLSLAGTQWTKMSNSWGAMWELSGLPTPPLDLRVTSDTGDVLLARQAITQPGVTGKLDLPIQFATAGTPDLGAVHQYQQPLTGADLRAQMGFLLPPVEAQG